MSGVGLKAKSGESWITSGPSSAPTARRENAGTELNRRRGEQLNVERGGGGDADGIEQDLHAQVRVEAPGTERDDGRAAERRVGRLNVFGREAQGRSAFVPTGGEADLLIRSGDGEAPDQ